MLKDFVGRVIDLAFAHTDDIMLAVVDEIGNLCVYELKQMPEDGKITYPFPYKCCALKICCQLVLISKFKENLSVNIIMSVS